MNTTNSTHRSTFRPFALTLVLGLIGATQALADQPATVTVGYSDLDLNTSAGAHTLYSRISGAARTVCGFEGTALVEQSMWTSCYRAAIADAVAKVNSPLLTALQAGRPAPTTVAMLRQ